MFGEELQSLQRTRKSTGAEGGTALVAGKEHKYMKDNLAIFVPIHDATVSADIGEHPLHALISGAAGLDSIPVYTTAPYRDDKGDSISDQYDKYGKLTAVYWAWKNPDLYGNPEAVGFVPLSLTFGSAKKSAPASASEILRQLEHTPLIAVQPDRTIGGKNVHGTFEAENHNPLDLDVCLDIINADYPQMAKAADAYMIGTEEYPDGAFIMRRDTFDQYCAFLFDVLAKHDRLVNMRYYEPEQYPVPQFLERYLTGIFIKFVLSQVEDEDSCFLPLVHAHRGLSTFTARTVRKYRAFSQRREQENAPAPYSHFNLVNTICNDRNSYAVVKVECDEQHPLPSDVEVHASARSNVTNAPTPARVISTSAGPAVISPVSSFPKTLTITATHEGKEVASSVFVLDPASLAEQSQHSIDANDSTAKNIAGSDANPVVGDVHITADVIIRDNPSGMNIVHGRITIPLINGHEADDRIAVAALTPEGTPFDGAPVGWTCMGDGVSQSPAATGLKVRTVLFSVRVPIDEAFLIWVRFPRTAAEDGFTLITKEEAINKRKAWRNHTRPAYADLNYDTWLQLIHRVRPEELEFQKLSHFDYEPTYSIVVPVYRTPLEYFKAMVDSVKQQSYQKWELLLVDASPDDAALEKELDAACASDPRIKRVAIEKNEGITLNTNAGILAANGDFVCFLDHDDFLEGDALYRYTKAINAHPDTDLLYCDEDKYECDGKFLAHPIYREPAFKPDWNPDLLLTSNYLCHFMAVRKSVLDGITLPGAEFDGSQDWNMAWLVAEKARHIHHEARVLYHWRSHHNSTASHRQQKNYALEAGRLAVEQHLQRMGIQGRPIVSRRAGEGYFHIRYDLGDKPLVSIIIPNKDCVTVLHRCLSSILRKSTYENFEIVIVENNSTDPQTFEYYKWITHFDKRIRVAYDTEVHGFNFSQIVNFGVAQAHGDYLLLLNNDTEVLTPDWIEEMLGPCMRRPDVGAVGAELLYPDDTIQHAGVTLAIDGPAHLYPYMPSSYNGNLQSVVLDRDMPAVTGACMMTRRDAFDRVGGFDENLPNNYNDTDFCLKLGEQGLRVVYNPEVVMRHYESVSRGLSVSGVHERTFKRDRGYFMHRWPEAYVRSQAPGININFSYGAYDTLDMEQKHEGLY